MRQKFTSLLIISLVLALLTPLPVLAQDFGPTLKAIAQVKPKNADGIDIKVQGENFSVSLREGVAEPRVLGTFPLDQWPAFIEAAVKHGLVGYRRFRSAESESITLTFLSSQNTKLDTGRGELNLPRSFFDYMQVLDEFLARLGKNGFAILIYDPHQSVPGRFELVPALNELVRSNPSLKFKLLNEGEYERADRNILFNGLDDEFKNLPTGPAGSDLKPALAYTLLERFMIDCAMAYRLIYNEKMPAIAIDDNASLADDSRIIKGVDEEEFRQNSLIFTLSEVENKVGEFLSNHPKATPRLRALGDEILKTSGDNMSALDESPDSTSRNWATRYQKAAVRLKRIAELAEKFQLAAPAAQLKVQISKLKGQDPFQFSSALAQNYAKREAVMAQEIIREAKFTSPSTPIAFLGYGHFFSITEDLQKQDIGYVVVSPRSTGLREYRDGDKFTRFISPATRTEYLKEATHWNKGPVGLTAGEIATFIRPFLKQGAANLQTQRLAERNAFAKQADFTVQYDKVLGAVNSNGILAHASVEVETSVGNKVPPKAIAYFVPGANGARSRLVILDPKGDGWRGPAGQARYDTLRNAPLAYRNPYVRGNDPLDFYGYRPAGDTLNFYEFPDGRSAAIFYDSAEGRTYLIDGGSAAMSDLLTLRPNSRPQGGGSTRIRVFIAELEQKRERKTTTNAE